MFHVGQWVKCSNRVCFCEDVPPGLAHPHEGDICEIVDIRIDALGQQMLEFREFPPLLISLTGKVRKVPVRWIAAAFDPLPAFNVAIVEALKNLPPLDELEPPTPDERPMQ